MLGKLNLATMTSNGVNTPFTDDMIRVYKKLRWILNILHDPKYLIPWE